MDRYSICQSLVSKLKKHNPKVQRVFLGMDGFVDNIIEVVQTRHSETEYSRFESIPEFAEAIASAGGKSANFELIQKLSKLGGNGPIMANALRRAGYPVTYIGTIGQGKADEVFSEFAEFCEEIFPILRPGVTDAYEFSDGKLMMGRYEHLNEITWSKVKAQISEEKFSNCLQRSSLMGMVNWTMIMGMTEVWRGIQEDLLSQWKKADRNQWWFVDLTDPAKRTVKDLLEGLEVLKGFTRYFKVVLGLNRREADQISKHCGLYSENQKDSELAQSIQQYLKYDMVIVHPSDGAGVATSETADELKGPYTTQPKLTTGAGDNFNAGFCNGLLAGASPQEALCSGVCTSGYYVRKMRSPALDELIQFIEFWSEHLELSEVEFDQKFDKLF